MQLAQDHNKVIKSNVQSETAQFAIKDMSLVMELLSKLYSNPINTITQEYISNARDAHRETRTTKKIEVTAPSRFSPTLRITDYGPGLSPDRIKNVFLFYGASTKRNNDVQTGGFGIGAKSAWAYTDSFTIITNHDGMCRTYIAHKSGGNGNLNLLSEVPTNEANGTTIEIAVSPNDTEKFKQAILRTVFFWQDREKPVLKGFTAEELKGNESKPEFDLFKEFKTYNELPWCITNQKDIVVIDGIPYPNHLELPKLRYLLRQKFVLFLNTGDVTMLPSREEFTKDAKATTFFTDLDKKLSDKITNHIDSIIAALPNVKDGLKKYIELKTKFNFDGKYKDYGFDNNNVYLIDPIKAKISNYRHDSAIVLGDSWRYRGNNLKKAAFERFPYNNLNNIYYDDIPNEAAVKKVWRVRKTLNTNSGTFRLIKGDLSHVAIELGVKPLSSIDASDYKQAKIARTTVTKQEICIHFYNGTLTPKQVTIANVTTTIVYASYTVQDVYNKRFSGETSTNIRYINSLPDASFAFIADSYSKKILSNKHFVKYEDFLKTITPSEDAVKYCLNHKAEKLDSGINLYMFNKMKKLGNDFKDPVLKYFIELANFKPKLDMDWYFPSHLLDATNKHVIEYEAMVKVSKAMFKRYPLFTMLVDAFEDRTTAEVKKDALDYFNTKYKKLG